MEKKSSPEIVEGGEEGEISAMETSAEEVGLFYIHFLDKFVFIFKICVYFQNLKIWVYRWILV